MEYKLSPSDLTFLYEGCKHCFVLKVKYNISQPSIPVPGVFSTIATLQKNYYCGKRTEDFCPQLPPGTVVFGERWVRSKPVGFGEINSTCYIYGRFDVVVKFDDGSYGVIDFKTGNANEEKAEMYSRQLHAYAYALEHAVSGTLGLHPVSRLGLLYFTPDTCNYTGQNRQLIEGQMTWIAVEKNEPSFLGFLSEVLSLLDGNLPEPRPDTCAWCRYRMDVGRIADQIREGGAGL